MTAHRPNIITCQEEIPFPGGRVRFLNPPDTVHSAMTLLEIDGITILIDCGADPFDVPTELPEEAYEADAVLLTHGHMDHVGGIPSLLSSGFFAPIFATETTLAITRIVLGDCIRQKGGVHRDVRAFSGGLDHITKAAGHQSPFKPFPKRNIVVTFHPAGHILGASSIEIKTDSAHLLFSGDLGSNRSAVAGAPNTTWNPDDPFDLVVMESTCGDITDTFSTEKIGKALTKVITDAQKQGGHIIVPASIIGRTQELIHLVGGLAAENDALQIPVALDSSMGLRIANDFEPLQQLLDERTLQKLSRKDDPLNIDGLYTVRKTKDPKRLKELSKTTLIITGFGNCDAGRVVPQLRELLPHRETTVLFIGYQAPGSVGHQILEASHKNETDSSETVEIKNRDVTVRANVKTIPGLYAHANQQELVSWLQHVPGVTTVALHHGSKHAQEALAAAIQK